MNHLSSRGLHHINVLLLTTLLCCTGKGPGAVDSDKPAPKDEGRPAAAAPKKPPEAKGPEEEAAEEKAPSVMDSHAPLTPEAEALFFGSKEDAPPKVLDAQMEQFEGAHFLYSDEANPEKFLEKIKDLGGGYAGVGTDQGYLFIGWMKPHLAWLSDYDPWVVLLHLAYIAFFEASETYEGFYERWWNDSRGASLALLEETYKDHPSKRLILEVFKAGRGAVFRRLGRLRRHLQEKNVPGFITDQEQYAFVRNLILAKRVRPILGNLLDKYGLNGISEVSKKLEVPIRALYVSNAESYWPYDDQFRENIYNMNFDDSSLVMRTFATKPQNGDYAYGTQSGKNFQEWLRQPFVKELRHVWQEGRYSSGEGDYPFTHLDRPPEKKKRPIWYIPTREEEIIDNLNE